MLRLFGRRDLRSINSWMHNSERLVRNQAPTLMMHPFDAADRDIVGGQTVRVRSDCGEVEIPVEITDEVMRGSISYPHGWGHRGSWQRANTTEGVNINELSPVDAAKVEQISGASFLDGIPVEVQPVRSVDPADRKVAGDD